LKHALFGDIHGNSDALTAVLSDIQSRHSDNIYCLGDIVGYGAEPRECLGRIRDLACPTVAGNHDIAGAANVPLDDFNEYARKAIYWTRQQLTDEDRAWLSELPFVIHYEVFSMVHSSLSHPEAFPYILSDADADRCFARMETPLCFIAHSHVPLAFFDAVPGRPAGHQVDFTDPMAVRGKMIVNPGSVGQPRDGAPQAAYCIYDDTTQHITFRRVEYDVAEAARKVRAAGLPELLAWRLEIGR